MSARPCIATSDRVRTLDTWGAYPPDLRFDLRLYYIEGGRKPMWIRFGVLRDDAQAFEAAFGAFFLGRRVGLLVMPQTLFYHPA